MNIRGPFTRIKYEDINLNSADQVKKYLLSAGWIPTQYNKNKETGQQTSPKLTEDSFDSIQGDTGKLLARRAVLVHRRRQIENYKDPENKGFLSFIRDDGRVPAEGITCATNTFRSKHKGAICNVPKNDPKVILGKEVRELFYCIPPYLMLGADLCSIETRVISHYAWQFDGGHYWEVISKVPDIHQYTADKMGISRSIAKNIRYALYFGALPPKIASMLMCSLSEAERIYDDFWKTDAGVKNVVDYLVKFYKKHKYIVGLDGRKLSVRAEYKLLNTLIQSAAAIVFKRWDVIVTRELLEKQLDCTPIIRMHDEIQYRVHQDVADISQEIVLRGAASAGEYYSLKVPIAADCKLGANWAETH